MAAGLLFAAAAARGRQVADASFSPPVPKPAYKEGTGPLVLLDEAHQNFHTISGRYLAFAKLVRRDGYRISGNRDKFSAASLRNARILVIANALNERNANGNWRLPTPSAFDSSEIAAVREWVRGGGSLMLVSDHMPFPGAMGPLSEEFGVHMMNGFAMQNDSVANGIFVHTRKSGALASSAITRGVDSVKVFTGPPGRRCQVRPGPGSRVRRSRDVFGPGHRRQSLADGDERPSRRAEPTIPAERA